jgi:protein-S-isoprenylcysteine O-methyltransferase Ste14
MSSKAALIRTIFILPGNVVIVIPSTLLWVSYRFLGKTTLFSPNSYVIIAALIFLVAGLALSIATVRLFVTIGRGTPAPWDPPRRLVVAGPYRYVRNPMISSVLCMLLGESMLFDSWLILLWFVFFLIANMIYLPLFEENGLEARFGEEYREYKKHVPQWIPRLSAWDVNKNK